MRKHQNETQRIRQELDNLTKRQDKVQEEYVAVLREIARYNQADQEQIATETNENPALPEELVDTIGDFAASDALIQQNKSIQEDIIDRETELHYLERDKQKLIKCLSLLIAQKPEAYILLSGSREEQLATVANYHQYLMDFVAAAQETERQQQIAPAAFLSQDISLLREKANVLKQQQQELKYPETEIIQQVRELALALEDMAQDYGWETSLVKPEPQSVIVTNQSVSQLRQQANDILVVAPPGILSKLGVCGQWKKSLFELLLKAKSMQERAYSPAALRAQIITGLENVLLECNHLTQRIYENCYKHLSVCGHSLDQAGNKLQDEIDDLTKQLLNIRKQTQPLREPQRLGLSAVEGGLRQSPEKLADKAAEANARLEELTAAQQAVSAEIAVIAKQLEDSLSLDNAARISLVREWIRESQHRPENKSVIAERLSDERLGRRLAKNYTASEAVAQNVVADQPELVVVEIREWRLPVAVMTAKYKLEGERSLTLLEKFTMKCIANGQGELNSSEAIAGLLNLEEPLVESCVNKLVECCWLTDSLVGRKRKYELSALGNEVYQTGKVAAVLAEGSLGVTVNAQYEWLEVWQQGVNHFGGTGCDLPVFRYCNPQEEQLLRNYYPDDMQAVNHVMQTKLTEWYSVQQQDYAAYVQQPQYQQEGELRFAEIWVYDVVHNLMVCHVWNFAQQTYCSELEFALHSLEGRERLEQLQSVCYKNQQWLELITKLRNQDNVVDSPVIAASLFGAAKRNALLQAIDDTQTLLLLLVPELATVAADAELLTRLRKAVKRGGSIYIAWGTAHCITAESQLPPAEDIAKLQNILDAEGLPGVFVIYVGSLETQAVVVDEQYSLLSWLPCLSYQNSQVIQEQSVVKVIDKSSIRKQQLKLQGLVLKQLEKQLLENGLANPVTCITWFYALLKLNEHSYIREVLAEEALKKVMSIHSEQILFKLLAVYVQANQYELGCDLLLKRLAGNEDSYNKLTFWLDKLRTRNPKAAHKLRLALKAVTKKDKSKTGSNP